MHAVITRIITITLIRYIGNCSFRDLIHQRHRLQYQTSYDSEYRHTFRLWKLIICLVGRLSMLRVCDPVLCNILRLSMLRVTQYCVTYWVLVIHVCLIADTVWMLVLPSYNRIITVTWTQQQPQVGSMCSWTLLCVSSLVLSVLHLSSTLSQQTVSGVARNLPDGVHKCFLFSI